MLKRTPSAYLGSCRYKLPEIKGNTDFYDRIFEILDKMEIEYFFYLVEMIPWIPSREIIRLRYFQWLSRPRDPGYDGSSCGSFPAIDPAVSCERDRRPACVSGRYQRMMEFMKRLQHPEASGARSGSDASVNHRRRSRCRCFAFQQYEIHISTQLSIFIHIDFTGTSRTTASWPSSVGITSM